MENTTSSFKYGLVRGDRMVYIPIDEFSPEEVNGIPNLFVENAVVLPGGFRNFAGCADKYNNEGNRNFSIVIFDEHIASCLQSHGWNVRRMKPRNDGDEPSWKLNITVSFRKFKRLPSTRVILYVGGKMTDLTEETVDALDYAEYRTADMTIRPRLWTNERTGERRIKAYLQEMRVVIEENPWDRKYASYDNPPGEEETEEDVPF